MLIYVNQMCCLLGEQGGVRPEQADFAAMEVSTYKVYVPGFAPFVGVLHVTLGSSVYLRLNSTSLLTVNSQFLLTLPILLLPRLHALVLSLPRCPSKQK
jgi:hypothetical protein